MKKLRFCIIQAVFLIAMTFLTGCSDSKNDKSSEDEIVIRVCSWEEYIDEGGWDEDELIELDNGKRIIGVNPMIDDFEVWFEETYGKKVRVEYSTFGTNEDLYNQLTMGDVYDLVCPSDYMIMKLMAEEKLVPFSNEFFDKSDKNNYYINGVSDYINDVFRKNKINDESWAEYAAGFMWGTTGIVYNPDYVTKEQASSWRILTDESLNRKVTIKDNVRDSLFAAMGIYRQDVLLSEEFKRQPDYTEQLQDLMNDTSQETIEECEKILKQMKENVYSFETDSGKSDMVTGKVYANLQWSGDAVYTMDQAEEDGVYLNYAYPEECSNLWFDGWIMLKAGIDGNSEKQKACEAFINFLSRPDNAVRNMYYIGYTSVISGGDDDTMLSYAKWNYGAEDEEDTCFYDVSYFFGENSVITTTEEHIERQLGAQYPSEEIISKCAVMWYFNEEESERINQMWINVRCFNMSDAAGPLIILLGILLVIFMIAFIYLHRHKVFNIKKK